MSGPTNAPPQPDNTILYEAIVGPRLTSGRVVAGCACAVFALALFFVAWFFVRYAQQGWGVGWVFLAGLAAVASGGLLWGSYRLLSPYT